MSAPAPSWLRHVIVLIGLITSGCVAEEEPAPDGEKETLISSYSGNVTLYATACPRPTAGCIELGQNAAGSFVVVGTSGSRNVSAYVNWTPRSPLTETLNFSIVEDRSFEYVWTQEIQNPFAAEIALEAGMEYRVSIDTSANEPSAAGQVVSFMITGPIRARD